MSTPALSVGTCWGYSDDEHAERWIGTMGTRAQAILEGRETYKGEPFWIASGTACSPGQFMPDADELLELAAERAYDEVGEASEDWPPPVSKEARKELDDLIAAWAEKHLKCEFWLADGVKELIEPHPATHRVGEGESR